MEPTETEIAWAAGLYEGEGTVVAARRRARHYARLQVYSSDLDVIERWQQIFGGRVYTRRPNPQALGTKIGHYVEIGEQARVRPVLEAMLPWLGERRRAQIAAVLEKVDANPPLAYHTGWDTRRALYGPNGRRASALIGK